mgnify:CR=1 FL=1
MPVALTDHIDRSEDKYLLRGRVGTVHSWVCDGEEGAGRVSRGGETAAPTAPTVDAPSQDLSSSWSYSSEEAPEPAFVKSARDAELTINPIGFYQGVSVTGENLPPHVANEMGVMPAVLTWSGFERTDASSRGVFQLH